VIVAEIETPSSSPVAEGEPDLLPTKEWGGLILI
jgi:hypothetical protein